MHVVRSRSVAILIGVLAALTASAGHLAAQSGSFGNSVVFTPGEMLVGEPNTTFRPGTVYRYVQGPDGWVEAGQLQAPEPERADGFGSVLAVSGDVLLVGQRTQPLHVYRRSGDGWAWEGRIEGPGTEGLDPGCGQYGYCGTDFGIRLAASGDWLLIGAPGDVPQQGRRGDDSAPAEPPTGALHVYTRTGDGWRHAQTMESPEPAAGDRFGAALAVDGDRVWVGAPGWGDPATVGEGVGRVFAFQRSGETWTSAGAVPFDGEANANVGHALAHADGRLVVGAPGLDDSRGAALVFAESGDGWRLDHRLEAPERASGDRFASGLALDGTSLWVGAPTPRENDRGTAFVFEWSEDAGEWTGPDRFDLTDTVNRDEFGTDVTASDGVVAISAPGMHHQSGSIQVFERTDGGAWEDRGRLLGPPDAIAPIMGAERRCEDGRIGPFDCDEVELLSFVPNSILRAGDRARGVRTNDNWGWTDPETGQEYALVGRNDGTSFIDITDPTNPVLVADLPKPENTPASQLWRDIKVYRDHAFIVADGAGAHGMQVFDLTRLRDMEAPSVVEPDVHYTQLNSSHNIVINEESGFAYAVGNRDGGETCGGGLHMIDINDPKNPTFTGCFAQERGTHDSQCVIYQGPDQRYQGRELCMNSNGGFFAIVDVTDKENPVALSRASSPNAGYIHQGWLTDDHRYFYQDDEADVIRGSVETTRTLVWDLTDVEDPVLVNQFMGSMPASAHNLYIVDDHAYQANYRYGLHVLDVSDPLNPVEVGFFDTSPHQTGPGFSGAWSTYPFFESGTVIVTSLQEGLFILKKRDRPVS